MSKKVSNLRDSNKNLLPRRPKEGYVWDNQHDEPDTEIVGVIAVSQEAKRNVGGYLHTQANHYPSSHHKDDRFITDKDGSVNPEIQAQLAWLGAQILGMSNLEINGSAELGAVFNLAVENPSPGVYQIVLTYPEIHDGEDGEDGEDGSDAQATMIRDQGDGQLQTSPTTPVLWANVANAKYLHLNGDNAMTGGLEIENALTTEPSLVIKAPTGSAQAVWRAYTPEGTLRQELLSNGRFFHYGSTGNVRFDGAGNEIAFTRIGASWISASDNSDNLTTVRMRVAGVDALGVYTQGRVAVGVQGFRGVALHVQSTNSTWPAIIARPAASNSVDIFQTTDPAGVMNARIKADGSGEMGANDAGTNTYPDGLSIYHQSSGTPVAGFGVGLRWQGKSSTTNKRDMALLRAVWETSTDATRKAEIILSAYDTAERQVIKAGANGSAPTIGFLGADKSPRVNVGVIDCEGNEAAKVALDTLLNFGFIQGTINLGTAPEIPEIPEIPDFLPAFSKCQFANSTARVMFWRYYKYVADYLAADLGVYDFNFRMTDLRNWFDIRIPNWDWFETDLCFELWVDFGNNSDPTGFTAHMGLAQAYFESVGAERLFCYMDDNGIITSTQYSLMMTEIETSSGAGGSAEYFYRFMNSFDRQSMADFTSLGAHSSYIYDGDCESFDCANWNVFMNFPVNTWSGSVTQTSGEYEPGVGYVGIYTPPDYQEGIVLEILSHITRAEISVYQEFSVAPDQSYVYDIATGGFTTFTPLAGGDMMIWEGNAPDGIRIFHGGNASHVEDIPEVITINLFGIGTAPTP